MKKHAFSCLVCIFFCSFLIAQPRKIEILSTDNLLSDQRIGNGVQRLIGNVSLKDGNTFLYCDSAYRYPNNSIDAFSNVRIQQGDSVTIFGNYLNYSGNTRIAELQKNIRFIQKGSVLQTELLFYDMTSAIATYPNGGTITSKDNTLISDYGNYNSRSRMFSFKKNVVLTNPQYVMTCDTLNYNSGTNTAYFTGPTHIKSKGNYIYCESGWYDTDNDIAQFSKNAYILSPQQKMKGDTIHFDKMADVGRAFGHVAIIDSAQRIIVTGDKAIRNGKTETSTVTGRALLKQYDDTDTLFLHADTLRSVDEHPVNKKNVKDTSITWRVMYAYNKVKFFRSDIQGKCDSLVYSGKDSIMRLYKSPVLWSEKNQLTGENIELKTNGGEITKMYIKNSAFIISKEDSVKFNQIKGKQMTGTFKENKLSKIFVEGNGQTIYFAKDKEKLIGVNRADCNSLMIYVKENAVEKITFHRKPDATLFPMSDFVPKEFLLKDFVWREQERPASVTDIFLR